MAVDLPARRSEWTATRQAESRSSEGDPGMGGEAVGAAINGTSGI